MLTEDWDALAQVLADNAPEEGEVEFWLMEEPWVLEVLAMLTIDQLRYLHDATRRLDLNAALPRMAVKNALTLMSSRPVQAMPGRAYGSPVVETRVLRHGDPTHRREDDRFQFLFRINFKPGDAADADEIAFIQTVRKVDSDTGENISDYGTMRMTEDHTKVDRKTGREQGWYGVNDDDTNVDGAYRPWTRGGSAPAFMLDKPASRIGNCDWTFETSVVCREGRDAGMVYAVVVWGFTVDADLKVTPKPHQIFNKPTKEFGAAVGAWNNQAAGPRQHRNALGQKPLPMVR